MLNTKGFACDKITCENLHVLPHVLRTFMLLVVACVEVSAGVHKGSIIVDFNLSRPPPPDSRTPHRLYAQLVDMVP